MTLKETSQADSTDTGQIRAVISDFGGVLTSPLNHGISQIQEQIGITPEQFWKALTNAVAPDGTNLLFELEKGRLTEREFLSKIEESLEEITGKQIALDGFGRRFFGALSPNEELFEYFRGVKTTKGIRLAIITNNVREWESYWRSMLPIEEIFELVVDSAFVGMRKPELEIFQFALAELMLSPAECVFIDDTEEHVVAARSHGLQAVHFKTNDESISTLEGILGSQSS